MTLLTLSPTGRARAWMLAIVLLVALRIPSLTHPAGGDQSLYLYSGQRVLAGDTPYLDVWDQKPPGIMFVYAALWRIWPHESVVAAADLVAAALTAWLLVILGRRLFSPSVGMGTAAVFLLLGDPSLQRLGGLAWRAQCETFIVAAVALALVLVTAPRRRSWHLVLGGVSFGVACWLKYNAIAYALPLVLAVAFRGPRGADEPRRPWPPLALVAAGVAGVALMGLGHFAVRGALGDLWRATIDYNIQYSGETYEGVLGPLAYLFTMPVARARVDVLWFFGLAGAAVLAMRARGQSTTLVLAWIAAVVLSIGVNGARGLPQYFIQAPPALALAATAGLVLAWPRRSWRAAALVVMVAGLWRVGSEPTPFWQPRLGGLPSIASNLAIDVPALTGHTNPRDHLAQFSREGGKFPMVAVADLAARVRATTSADDPVLVFGFAGGGVLARAGRVSASRFFWSRPVVLEFLRDAPGYGSRGMLEELRRRPPALVVLQRHDWALAEPGVLNSIDFFMANHFLRAWLESGYTLEDDGPSFVVWRKRS